MEDLLGSKRFVSCDHADETIEIVHLGCDTALALMPLDIDPGKLARVVLEPFEPVTIGTGYLKQYKTDDLRVWVALGPTVYRFKGEVYDRVADTDVRLRTDDQISAIYLRKRNRYTEQRIYPYLTLDCLQLDLLQEARHRAVQKRAGHPWATMTDENLLKSARLYSWDPETGERGYNLACILLLGREDIIGSVCPAYKTDAVMRRTNADRYDDRLVVKSNLIDAYDALMGFVRKHTLDTFHLEGTQAISLRDIIARELISNMLIHREYTSPYPAKIIIDNDGLHTENASRSLYEGRITLRDFNPMPKNPIIADFFAQIGWAEELGSGTRNLYKYAPLYGGEDPVMEDGDIFKTLVKLPDTSAAPTTAPKPTSDIQRDTPLSVEDVIEAMLGRNELLDAASLARAAKVTERTARRHLARLLKEGRLVAHKVNRTRHYAKP